MAFYGWRCGRRFLLRCSPFPASGSRCGIAFIVAGLGAMPSDPDCLAERIPFSQAMVLDMKRKM